MTENNNSRTDTPSPALSPSQLERGLDAVPEAEQAQMPSPGTVIDGKYRIDRLIARGGMGAVFAASHNVSGKKVAVKWMLPSLGQIKGARERFIREACATARITHPNIVDIYDVGADRGSVYLVMEYLHGETLAARLTRAGGLTPTDVISMLIPAMRGVAAAHAHGVIHRDLKPDNIMLCTTEDGDELDPKVLDFGISKIASNEASDLNLTYNGTVLGTPYYMSPEQVRGPRWVDERTDVYAFGVILFEALTGERPFDADTYDELIVKIATGPTPKLGDRIKGIDPALTKIVEHAMARDPNERFASVEALARALERFSDGVRFRTTRSGRLDRSFAGSASMPGLQPLPTPVPLHHSQMAYSQHVPHTPAPPQPQSRARTAAVLLLSGLVVALGLVLYTLRKETHAAGPVLVTPPSQGSTIATEPRAGLEAKTDDDEQQLVKDLAGSVDFGDLNGKRSRGNARAGKGLRGKRRGETMPASEAIPTSSGETHEAQGGGPSSWDEQLGSSPTRRSAPAAGKIDNNDI